MNGACGRKSVVAFRSHVEYRGENGKVVLCVGGVLRRRRVRMLENRAWFSRDGGGSVCSRRGTKVVPEGLVSHGRLYVVVT